MVSVLSETQDYKSGEIVYPQVLPKKMTVLYKLAREQLSKQYHYDFGLRALKAVLVMAGELKRGASELPEVSFCLTENILFESTFVGSFNINEYNLGYDYFVLTLKVLFTVIAAINYKCASAICD